MVHVTRRQFITLLGGVNGAVNLRTLDPGKSPIGSAARSGMKKRAGRRAGSCARRSSLRQTRNVIAFDRRIAAGNRRRRKPSRARYCTGRGGISTNRLGRGSFHPIALGQVVLIQFAAAVESLWVVPGFGQPIGAVMFRIGMVMIRVGSQLENSYWGKFLLNPVTASL
jgi:hypothetical protein